MPPKASQTGKQGVGEKPKKVTALQAAVDGAVADARRLYRQHEQQRLRAEAADMAAATRQQLLAAVEAVRLRDEAAATAALHASLHDDEQLTLREHAKHELWRSVPSASRLPDVDEESAINTFLRIWREREDAVMAATRPTTTVTAARVHSSLVMTGAPHSPYGAAGSGSGGGGGSGGVRMLHFLRGEQGIPATRRRLFVDEELQQCVEACALARLLQRAHDAAVAERRRAAAARYARSLCDVYAQVLHSLDVVTVYALLYYDVMLDADGDGEMLMRCVSAPPGDEAEQADGQQHEQQQMVQQQQMQNVLLKYGLWVKVRDMTRSFTSLVFGALDVRLDPKQQSLPKLPRALGLSKENVAVRVLQMAFDPYAGYTATCGGGAGGSDKNADGSRADDDNKDDDDDDNDDGSGRGEYYALQCTLKVDLLSFSDRPRHAGEWHMRGYTDAALALHTEAYPPHNSGSEGRITDDPAFRITFDLPTTIVLRQPTMLMGRWVSETREWEPCSHTTIESIVCSSDGNMTTNTARTTAGGGGSHHHYVSSAGSRPRSQQQQQQQQTSSDNGGGGNGTDAHDASATPALPQRVSNGLAANNNGNGNGTTDDGRLADDVAGNNNNNNNSHVTAATPAATMMTTSVRRATFVTSELAHFAVLQERVYDAPYESWSVRPLSDDAVLLTLEGRARGEAGDREFRVLVRDAACRLLAPDDVELEALRAQWQSPTSLFCALARAGFNFMLRDGDARYLPGVTPRSAALEARAYAEVAQFGQYFCIASSRHNRHVEDADMALFRVSGPMRPVDTGDDNNDNDDSSSPGMRGAMLSGTTLTPLHDVGEWHSVRYRRDSCALCALREGDEVAQLRVRAGHETHHDLYATLLPLYGEATLKAQQLQTNYLLRRCVHQILTLVRPLSWG